MIAISKPMDLQAIRQAIRAHYLVQLGGYISGLTDMLDVRLAYNSNFENIWYNSAYDIQTTPSAANELIDRVEAYMARHKRTPSIYVSPTTTPTNFGALLTARGYHKVETESWLFRTNFEAPAPPLPDNITIRAVKSESEFAAFADIYRASYPSADVEAKIEACKRTLWATPPLVNLNYLVAYYDHEPVAMLTTVALGEYIGLYSGGTRKAFRSKGVMRVLTAHAESIAVQHGAKHLFLQCVTGSSAERAYKKLGYEIRFTRDCYIPSIYSGC